MSISIVQVTEGSGGNPPSHAAFTSPVSTASDIVVVCGAAQYNGTDENLASGDVTDSLGNTYELIAVATKNIPDAGDPDHTSVKMQVAIFLATRIATGADTLTVFCAGTFPNLHVRAYEISGASVAPVDASAVSSGDTLPPSLSLSPNQANDFVIAAFASSLPTDYAGSPSAPSGWTVEPFGGGGSFVGGHLYDFFEFDAVYQQVSGSGPVTPSLLTPASGYGYAAVAVALTSVNLDTNIDTGSHLPDATMGVRYSVTIAASGGPAPYTWTKISGSLPPGISLDASSGTISGTAIGGGNFSFAIQVTDADGGTATKTFTMDAVALLGGSWDFYNEEILHSKPASKTLPKWLPIKGF
jgi:hypothetical protein